MIAMPDSEISDDILVERAMAGDERALASLFGRHRHRLRQMVRLRMDRRLQGRVDPSDVLQEAFLDLTKGFASYSEKQSVPLYLWMRFITSQRLNQVHRRHLGTEMRDAARDVSLYQGGLPQAASASIAAQLLGHYTSAASAAVRSEMQLQLQEVLNGMDDLDREIIALRNFEELDNREAAEVLGLSPDTARKRYIRALKRLQDVLRGFPGLIDF